MANSHPVAHPVLEELFHFKQLKDRGWFGRNLRDADRDVLESEVYDFMINSGLELFSP